MKPGFEARYNYKDDTIMLIHNLFNDDDEWVDAEKWSIPAGVLQNIIMRYFSNQDKVCEALCEKYNDKEKVDEIIDSDTFEDICQEYADKLQELHTNTDIYGVLDGIIDKHIK